MLFMFLRIIILFFVCKIFQADKFNFYIKTFPKLPFKYHVVRDIFLFFSVFDFVAIIQKRLLTTEQT